MGGRQKKKARRRRIEEMTAAHLASESAQAASLPPSLTWGPGTNVKRGEMVVMQSATLNYDITPELRKKMVKRVEGALDSALDARTTIMAVKTLGFLDGLNVKREGNQIEERKADIQEATVVIRTAMQSPAIREKMAALSEDISTDTVETVINPIKPEVSSSGYSPSDTVEKAPILIEDPPPVVDTVKLEKPSNGKATNGKPKKTDPPWVQ